MKKLLLIAAAAMMSFVAQAETKTFTDDLTVSVNGESSTQQATVMVEELEDGNINFRLPNFVLVATNEDPETGEVSESKMGIGNIAVDNLPLTKGDNYSTFEFSGDLLITEGDLEGVELWAGPILGPIPLVLTGKMCDGKIFVNIDIDMMSTLSQIIHVEFGKDFVEEKTFNDKLTVSVNGESSTQDATVIVQYPMMMNNSDTQIINFMLNNFVLVAQNVDPETGEVSESKMGIGNIVVDSLALTAGKGFDTFTFQGDLLITEGDMEGVELWAGPILGAIPLVLNGKITDDKVYVNIDIDMMSTLGQIIHVEFGQDIKPVYTVTYVIDGETISTEQVEEGGTPTLPEAPEKEGHTFAGWTGVPETVTDDVTVTGSYTVNKYNVYYMVDGRIIYTEEVAYGEAIPNFTITPESDERYTRTFEGWDGEHYDTMPAHDVTYTAIISVVDGIDEVVNNQSSNGKYYDLSGRRVQRITKAGIYLVNGKRIFVK